MTPYRIAIVEDEAIVAMDIEERLNAMGYHAAGRTTSGEAALELIARQPVDLVLMDIRLRGNMDGITTAEEIRRRFEVPVIFLTAYSEDATLERAKLAEPYGYILKPFDDRELKSSIEIALYKHAAEKEIQHLNRLYDVLSQVNQHLVRARSREELLPAVCRLIVERGGIDLAWIGWMEARSDSVTPVASYGKRSDMVSGLEYHYGDGPQSQGNLNRTLRQGQPFVCNECYQPDCAYPFSDAPVNFGFHSCGAFPIRFQDQIRGVLMLCVERSGFFRRREIELLQEISADISFALDKLESEARRKQAETELRQSEERLRMALTAANQGLFDLNLQTGETIVSPEYATMLGYDPEAFVESTENWYARLHPEDKAQTDTVFQACLTGETALYRAEYRQRTSDNQWKWILSIGKIVEFDHLGKPLRMLGTHTDITDRKLAEEQRSQVEAQLRQAQKMEALGTLAGGIAHDFNNILGIIFGFTQLALENWHDGVSAEEELQEVFNAANRARDLVQQILAFSRMSESEKKPIQIGLIINEAMKMLRATLPSTIEIQRNIATKKIILGDPTQIHQVLMNLCTNAGYAMQKKGGVLEVHLTDETLLPQAIPPHSGLHPGPYVKLRVSDTGHGMTPEIVERIFEPFFTTKELGVGTGLGLSVVHGIVKSHNGFIDVKSAPGKGTTFELLIPAMEKTIVQEVLHAEPLPRGTERILVVDDEAMLAGVIKRMLERLGYSVVSCNDAIQAYDIVLHQSQDQPIDLVITDMTMPKMTGAALAERIYELAPNLPILLCTGFSDKIALDDTRRFGIRHILLKPVSNRDLSLVVRQVLDGK